MGDRGSAFFAIEEIAHGAAPGFVETGIGAVLFPARGTPLFALVLLGFSAGRAAVGKPRFVGPELKFFGTNDTSTNRKRHSSSGFLWSKPYTLHPGADLKKLPVPGRSFCPCTLYSAFEGHGFRD